MWKFFKKLFCRHDYITTKTLRPVEGFYFLYKGELKKPQTLVINELKCNKCGDEQSFYYLEDLTKEE